MAAVNCSLAALLTRRSGLLNGEMRVATTEHGATGRNQGRTFHTPNDLSLTPWLHRGRRSCDTPLNCFNSTVCLPLPSPLSPLPPRPVVL